MSGFQKYTELDAWKQGRFLAAHIYALTSGFPKAEPFGIISQMRRCAVSIPSNIAEDCGRQHPKEPYIFIAARGSLYELETQVYISKDLLFISEEELQICLEKIETVG